MHTIKINNVRVNYRIRKCYVSNTLKCNVSCLLRHLFTKTLVDTFKLADHTGCYLHAIFSVNHQNILLPFDYDRMIKNSNLIGIEFWIQ